MFMTVVIVEEVEELMHLEVVDAMDELVVFTMMRVIRWVLISEEFEGIVSIQRRRCFWLICFWLIYRRSIAGVVG
jgi:hypothetical protein